MKKILVALSLILMSFVPLSSVQAENPAQESGIYAVAFHADWCGSCKILGPNITKARGKADLDNQNVLFVKLDLTNAATRHQSSLMASALGIDDFYKNNAGKTGFVLLIDAKTGETLAKLNKDMDATQIVATIKGKLNAS